jgi:hypothetical protein
MTAQRFFLNKIESLRSRAKALEYLRKDLALPAERDIQATQWEALENQLSGVSNGLQKKLRACADRFLSESGNATERNRLVQSLGALELETANAFTFYDTYMDLLTQRLSQPIGALLKGCDAIAADGMQRGYLTEISLPPLVYCDRGFGAFTCREGVSLLPGAPNPIQFIAVPYARLIEKYNLISVYHEVGHQTLVKLNMIPLLQHIVITRLVRAGATAPLAGLFANWIKELAPDFWAFCLTGMAQTCSLRDVLFLPPQQAFQIYPGQQHPPSYLRMLASVAWCRHLWGSGEWDDWAQQWKAKYPLTQCDADTRQLLKQAELLLPVLAQVLCDARFRKLNNRPLSSLFALNEVAPEKLRSLATIDDTYAPAFKKTPIGAQLAAFRLMREKRKTSLKTLDAAMQEWLTRL